VTLLALAPFTGRTHQLRVHASHAGAPLLGDRVYGGPVRLTRPNGSVLPLSRIALHAARVVVPDARGEPFEVRAPIPDALESWWLSLGGEASAWDTAVSCPVGTLPHP
jgi:23S rRNA pseudouridine955/2504/2580 synthase/23S rRNA pseudouridine1911/1915/1917 synthase